MKRFLLFAGFIECPDGGWQDFKGSFDTLEEATSKGEAQHTDDRIEWWHIVDSQVSIIVRHQSSRWIERDLGTIDYKPIGEQK